MRNRWRYAIVLPLLLGLGACSQILGPEVAPAAAPREPRFIKTPAELCAERGGRWVWIAGQMHCLAPAK